MWKCRCDCGTVKDVGARALKTGMSISCGCVQKERVSKALTDDLTGKRFCYLTVISRNGSHCSSKDGKSNWNAVWHCKCDCGNELDVIDSKQIEDLHKSSLKLKKELNDLSLVVGSDYSIVKQEAQCIFKLIL